ncbi:MAG: hypothetical protein IJ019_04455 [Alphaproteobacteria bacterium]|nr:hypothetical protein [Alphaproteobacteria bacterium]
MKNFIKTADAAGFAILCSAMAISRNMTVVILPPANSKEEHDTKSAQAYDILSEIEELKVIKVAYDQRALFESEAWDVIADLKSNKFTLGDWRELSKVKLSFKKRENPFRYAEIEGQNNTLVVFQKLISDETFGATAAMQSLSADDFTVVWNSPERKVYGQHFHKVNDRESVVKFAAERNVYVPGLTENEEVFGIRGRKHGDYAGMYANVQKAVAIPGTHTWIMLFFYPEIHQLIPYRTGIENWAEIAQAWREVGHHIYTVEFNDSSNRDFVRGQIAFGYKHL